MKMFGNTDSSLNHHMSDLFNGKDSCSSYDEYVGYEPDIAKGIQMRIKEVLNYADKEW